MGSGFANAEENYNTMTYHDLSPELQEKVRANTIDILIKAGFTKKEAKKYLNSCIDDKDQLDVFFLFHKSPEGSDYWWDVMRGKIK